MSLNNILNFFLKKNIDDLYDINFQFNDRFYKICICYNFIHLLVYHERLSPLFRLKSIYFVKAGKHRNIKTQTEKEET
jgi:hypothetical protein